MARRRGFRVRGGVMGAFTLQAEIDEYGDLLDTALEE